MEREKLIIAVDFDGTVVEHMYPAIGKPLPGAFEVLKSFIEKGDRLILWTCRMPGSGLEEAVQFLKQNGIEFEEINNNVSDHNYANSRKIYASVYLDDRMIGGFPGWSVIENEVNKLRETLIESQSKEPKDKLLVAIDKFKEEHEKWKLFVSGSNQIGDTHIQLHKSRSTSSAILEAVKIIEDNNLWHYSSAVLITDTGYKYDLNIERMKKFSNKQFCYCGKPIDESNIDCITYALCKEHAADV